MTPTQQQQQPKSKSPSHKLLPKIVRLLTTSSSPGNKKRSTTTTSSSTNSSIKSWISTARHKHNFNQVQISSLMHSTFETHTSNRWLGGAKSNAKGSLTPLAKKRPEIGRKRKQPTEQHTLQDKEKRLERFGSRLGNTLPESMQTNHATEIAYLGSGMSVVLEKRNVSALLSSLEQTSVLLQNHTIPIVSLPGTNGYVEPGIDRYGHEGAWYERTPRYDNDDNGLRRVLQVGGHPSSPTMKHTHTGEQTNFIQGVPYDVMEQQPQRKKMGEEQDFQQNQCVDIPTPVSVVEVYAGGSQVLPNEQLMQVNNGSNHNNDNRNNNREEQSAAATAEAAEAARVQIAAPPATEIQQTSVFKPEHPIGKQLREVSM